MPERGHRSPLSIGGSGTGIMLYVDRVDDVFSRAIAAEATAQQPVTNHKPCVNQDAKTQQNPVHASYRLRIVGSDGAPARVILRPRRRTRSS
jgi:hypothetical protein